MTLCFEGLSHREIAQVLGISENNVAVRLTRARRARTPHRRIDLNADTDWTALTNAWPYPAETDARDDLLGIRRRVQAAGRRMALGMASEYAVAALLVALAVWKLGTNKGLDAFLWGIRVVVVHGGWRCSSPRTTDVASGGRRVNRRALTWI